MIKELEVLNDYVDGYLGAILDEPEGNLRNGKSELVIQFRDHLAKVPSSSEGSELVKILNRGLLKASKLPLDTTLNKRKGFEEALSNIQVKIKELFKIDDLTYGTVDYYLQDIPELIMPKKAELPEMEELFAGDAAELENTIRKIGLDAERDFTLQNKVLQDHLSNNGILIVISDNGYSKIEVGDKESALAGLIKANEKSKDMLKHLLDSALMHIAKLKAQRGGKGGDPFGGLFGEGGQDE